MLIGGSGLMLGIDGDAVFDWDYWSVIWQLKMRRKRNVGGEASRDRKRFRFWKETSTVTFWTREYTSFWCRDALRDECEFSSIQ